MSIRRTLAVALVSVAAVGNSGLSAQSSSKKSGDTSAAWVSPFWEVSQFENSSVSQTTITFLWVLNPGTTPIDISVVLHKQGVGGGGATVILDSVTCTKTVAAGVSEAFWVPLFCDPEAAIANGSLEITATGPVAPGGYIQTSTTYITSGQPDVLHAHSQEVPLQFYAK